MKAAHDISICALVPYPPNTTPSQRFRIEQWLPVLREQGIDVHFLPFADERLMQLLYQPDKRAAKAAAMAAALVRRIADVAKARRYDAVIIHRAACLVGPAVLERVITLLNRPVIFDFDDAIFALHTSAANRRFGWLKFPGKTGAICRMSAHIVTGNEWLGDYARQFNRNVTVIPTSVDTERFRPRLKPNGTAPVVVGWTGSSTSQTYLEAFAPMLRELTARLPIELRVHSDREPVLPGVPYVWRRWSADTEAAEIAAFDIGLMPMPDDQWARGKCAMKALLYQACGVPAVCSAIGANVEVISHGVNGMLAETTADWLAHIGALVNDAALRARLGQAGRASVEAFYSKEKSATRFAEVLRATVEEWRMKQELNRWNPQKSKSSAR